jgi:hypothetical protein
MARTSSTLDFTETEFLRSTEEMERNVQIPVKRSWGAFLLAIVEAVCVIAVTAARTGTALSSVLGSVTGWALFLHRDIFRIPALLLAIIGSIFNLFLLRRAYRLRNAPAAMWRKKPLTVKERWRISLVFTLSVLTLMAAGSEIYFHRLLHHSIM